MTSTGQSKAAVVVIWDLSVALDTVDHDVLSSRLETRFGLPGSVLDWLKEHSQRVSVQGALSDTLSLLFEVPQGSVLGAALFLKYTKPPGTIA